MTSGHLLVVIQIAEMEIPLPLVGEAGHDLVAPRRNLAVGGLPNEDAANNQSIGLCRRFKLSQAFVSGFVYVGYKTEGHNCEA